MARKKKPDAKVEAPKDEPVQEETSALVMDAQRLGEEVENFAEDITSEAYAEAVKLYPKILKCYENKYRQSDEIEEHWNIFNAQPDENQQYSGNSQCYIPAVRDAIKARMKRTLASLFPANHKHVDAVGSSGQQPFAQVSLLEHYIRSTNLKDIVRADLIAGDVTGQWNLYIDWTKSKRRVRELIKQPPILEDSEIGVEVEDITAEEEWDVKEETVITEGPDITPFATEDLAVYPPTCNDLQKATATAIRLRLSKEALEQYVEDGIFVGRTAKEIIDQVAQPDGARQKSVPNKKRTQDAGVRTEGTYKYALIYEVHTDLVLDEKRGKEPVFVYYAGPDEILGIIRNPFWCAKRPIISAPIERLQGSFFGTSIVKPVKFLQWNLNDYWNMGQDSAQYALLPIVMTDPLANPNYQSMVMGLAAVWLTNPQSTQFAQFPAIYKDAVALCQAIKQQINESMDVNDSMLGRTPPGRKNSQQVAAMAQEQQLNINYNATRYEEVMLNPLLEWMFELDRQFRTKELAVLASGESGYRAKIEEIPVQAFGERYFFRWIGTAYQSGLQRMQQMIAWMNVLRGIPPQQLNGRRLDITPILEAGTDQIFGPEVAPRILVDERNMFRIDPDDENLMMHNGLPGELHPGDDDAAHIQAHLRGAQLTGDPAGLYRAHIEQHRAAMQAKQQQQAGQMQQRQPGGPGIPGGAGPGVAGTPRPGAQPGQPRPQGPAGMIPADQQANPMIAGRG